MRVLLCVSHNPLHLRMKASELALTPPLGLAYIASYLRKHGHVVTILDNNVQRLNESQFKEFVKKITPDIVGFTAYTFNLNISLALASIVKEVDLNIKVVFGGPHPTCLPDSTLAHSQIDIVVVGEGEETLQAILDALSNRQSLKDIKGIWYKDNCHILQNPPRDYIEDLDSIPIPSYDLLDMQAYYQSATRKLSNKRFSTIITSRGCPYRCSFCSSHNLGKKARLRSPKNVVDELEHLVVHYAIGEFVFVDATFTIDKQRGIRICEEIRRRRLGISWICNSRANEADGELYAFMADAGCKSVSFGVESGNSEMLQDMKKDITLEQVENAVRLGKKRIGHVACSFIFGLPGDNLARARETVKFAKKLDPDVAVFYIACPVPGSELFDRAVGEGFIDLRTADWNSFSVCFPYLPTIRLSAISRADLGKLIKVAIWEFYFRPSYILKRIKRFKSLGELLNAWKSFLAYLNYVLTRIG